MKGNNSTTGQLVAHLQQAPSLRPKRPNRPQQQQLQLQRMVVVRRRTQLQHTAGNTLRRTHKHRPPRAKRNRRTRQGNKGTRGQPAQLQRRPHGLRALPLVPTDDELCIMDYELETTFFTTI